jgi:hypothetical protein
MRGRKALHELGRLAKLDLEHDGEVSITPEPFEVKPSDFPESIERMGVSLQTAPARLDGFLHRPLENRNQQVVLAAEIEVDRAGRDARRTRHVGDLGVEKAARREGFDGGPQNGVASIRFVWPRRQGGTTGFRRDVHE